MADDVDEGFTIRDRRRFLSEETTGPADASPEAPSPPAPTEAALDDETEGFGEMDDAEGGALPDVHAVLALFLNELRSLAWLRMGLIANPGTGEIERDMAQAKVAIDTVAFLASQLEATVPAEDRLPLRALVSDLQINFVEQSKTG